MSTMSHSVPSDGLGAFLARLAQALPTICLSLLVLAAWEGAIRVFHVSPYIVPAPSAIVATLVATSSNFFLNNILTYRDQRLKGRGLLMGWITFNLVCGIGALTNFGIAHWLFAHHSLWQVAALAGIAVTTVWNFAMSSVFTWKRS